MVARPVPHPRRLSVVRTVTVWAVVVAGCALLARLLVADLLATLTPGATTGTLTSTLTSTLTAMTFSAAVVVLAEVVLLGCVAWCAATTSHVVLAALLAARGGCGARRGSLDVDVASVRVRGCPEWARRLVLAACGVAIASGAVAAPAHAEGHLVGRASTSPDTPAAVYVDTTAGLPGLDDPSRDHDTAPDGLAGLPMPGRAPTPAPRTDATRTPGPAVDTANPAAWRVRPGDSLWRIAQTMLSHDTHGSDRSDDADDPDDADIARAWRQIYRLNEHRIGTDPDLLRVGVTLDLPSTPDGASR